MADSERDRTLRIEIPPAIFLKGAVDPVWTDATYGNGWKAVYLLGAPTLAVSWEGTIDLSGYARDYKTFYPSGGVLQQGGYMAEVGGDGCLIITTVATTPIDAENIVGQISYGTGPGFLNHGAYAAAGIGPDQQDWTTIMFSQTEMMVPNLNISPNTYGVLQSLNVQQSGSMSPSASDTLYVCKIALPFGTSSTSLTLPASRVILPGVMDQEPELEYLMRLSRSVELANQV